MPHFLQTPAFHLERWAAGVLLCVGLFGVLYWIAVHTETGQLLDIMMQRTGSTTGHPLPELDPENEWIAVWILLPPILACAALSHRRGRHGRWMILASAAVLVLGANLSTQAFKLVFSTRPVLVGLTSEWTGNSLPSGHTTMAASVAAAAFLISRPRDRALWGILAATWSAGWGAYIFVEGWHLPSDMIAAYLVVTAWTLLCGAVVLQTEARDPNLAPLPAESGRPGGPQAGLSLTLGAFGTLLGLVALLGPALRDGLASVAESTTVWLWIAGAALSSAPVYLLFAAMIPLFAAETSRVNRRAARLRRLRQDQLDRRARRAGGISGGGTAP
ncbi:phosphatase PAP2 family protein [Nesterenkonia lutea]|uniref:Membrane-associated phospholipid phosphatase n=1 Tax=Nesterenkonia lutea TaxID=272919 RepID=A0ABR9JAN3_9MICC|nr:phosphatase PAP2 family protein [Nesterenkonia lutea]MBE1522984.1 membrane-associated phospholipid phosphatase [Nesterenkonia lutea]